MKKTKNSQLTVTVFASRSEAKAYAAERWYRAAMNKLATEGNGRDLAHVREYRAVRRQLLKGILSITKALTHSLSIPGTSRLEAESEMIYYTRALDALRTNLLVRPQPTTKGTK